MSSPEQPPEQKSNNETKPESLLDISAEKANIDKHKADDKEKSGTKAAEIKESLLKRGAKKALSAGKMAAKGSGVVAGATVGAAAAGIWGLIKLYGEALFGDIMPKGGGGGGKKSGGGGHGGGGHGGGGHH